MPSAFSSVLGWIHGPVMLLVPFSFSDWKFHPGRAVHRTEKNEVMNIRIPYILYITIKLLLEVTFRFWGLYA